MKTVNTLVVLVICMLLVACGEQPLSAPGLADTLTPGTDAPRDDVAPAPGSVQAAIDQSMEARYGSVDADCTSDIGGAGGQQCMRYLGTSPITHTAWSEVFPGVALYLVELQRVMNGADSYIGFVQKNQVIAALDGKQYTVEDFGNLMSDAGVSITPDNHQQIAQAFALLTSGNFLRGQITFSALEPYESSQYNTCLRAHADAVGGTLLWCFKFTPDRLIQASTVGVEEYDRSIQNVEALLPVRMEKIVVEP